MIRMRDGIALIEKADGRLEALGLRKFGSVEKQAVRVKLGLLGQRYLAETD